MSKIFGGSKQKSYSTSSSSSVAGNRAFPFLQDQFGKPGASAYQSSLGTLSDTLGSFEDYRDATGFDFMEKLGLARQAGALSGNSMLQSGAALKSLAEYENNLEKMSLNNYLEKVLQLGNLGAQGGQIAGSAGGYSTQTSSGRSTGSGSSNSGGLGSAIGSIGAAIALSDERTKENINKIGVLPDIGLGVYEYNYKGDTSKFIGVMAQEVEERYPSALGPRTEEGFLTVDYDKLQEIMDGASQY